ncbi:hypothetical protein [Roseomonas sp. HF4]|uniref:hypothetical protein n=1 Tax=Roseomonas sp. HF4 TaxID=2562313 RepID=UPI0010C0F707|nr:hypothetical protein [Roseomonas sp. HF4]
MTDRARRALFGAAPLAIGAMPALAQPAQGQPGRTTPEAFGAAGDGRADDAPALQAAISALGAAGGIVLLGARTYRIDRGIVLDPTRVSLSGARAVLDGSRLPDSAALLTLTTPGGASHYDHAPQVIEGLVLRGRSGASRTTGIALATAVEGLSSRIALRNVSISGFGTGIAFGARAYLCQGYSLQVHACGTALAFTSSEDAGENISFHGCSFFNSDLAVANRAGAMATFFGCAFDYCRQWFLGSGLNQFYGCWFEKHRPLAAEDIPFDLVSGELMLQGGGIQISGVGWEEGNRNSHMFMIRDRLARVVLRDCFAWNWRTASGVLAGGEGRIVIDGLSGHGNRHVPAVTKDDRRHNVFGDAGRFAGPSLDLPCWITGQGAIRESAQALRWEADGRAYARAEAALSTERPRSGGRCLRILKGIGPGTGFALNVAAPIRPGQGFGAALWYRLAGPGPLGPVWFQIFWARHLATDADGAMRFGERQFWGEVQTPREDSALGEWRQVRFNSRALDATAAAPEEAPDWATHVLLVVSLVAAGAGTELFLDDVGGWLM